MAMLTDDDTCRCRVICTCGGDDWGEEVDEDERYATLQYENTAAADLDPNWPR
jgi:hypothetical protein